MAFSKHMWMWGLALPLALASYAIPATNLLGHAIVIGAVIMTATAAMQPLPVARRSGLGRRYDGEHE
jgi:hypothetical protein